MEGFCLFAGERDAPDALALPRAAPNKLMPNLTLSSAERRRFAARTGAPSMGPREQELNASQYDGNCEEAQGRSMTSAVLWALRRTVRQAKIGHFFYS